MKPAAIPTLIAILLVTFLAGSYISSIFLIAFWGVIIYAAIAAASTLLALETVRLSEEYSTDHPEKGSVVLYSLSVAREGFWPFGRIHIEMIGTRRGFSIGLPDQHLRLRRGARQSYSYRVSCPYRGIYVVGVGRLGVTDPLGLFAFYRRLSARTFYVYPRNLTARPTRESTRGVTLVPGGRASGSVSDPLLFRSLRPFAYGDSARDIDWKRSAALGAPVTKEYESTADDVATIVVDTRPAGLFGEDLIRAEDACVESALAIGARFVSQGTRCAIVGAGWGRFPLGGRGLADCRRATLALFFRGTIGPAELLRSEASVSASPGLVTVVSHSADCLGLTEEFYGHELAVVYVLTGGPEERARALQRARLLRNEGCPIEVVESAEDLC